MDIMVKRTSRQRPRRRAGSGLIPDIRLASTSSSSSAPSDGRDRASSADASAASSFSDASPDEFGDAAAVAVVTHEHRPFCESVEDAAVRYEEFRRTRLLPTAAALREMRDSMTRWNESQRKTARRFQYFLSETPLEEITGKEASRRGFDAAAHPTTGRSSNTERRSRSRAAATTSASTSAATASVCSEATTVRVDNRTGAEAAGIGIGWGTGTTGSGVGWRTSGGAQSSSSSREVGRRGERIRSKSKINIRSRSGMGRGSGSVSSQPSGREKGGKEEGKRLPEGGSDSFADDSAGGGRGASGIDPIPEVGEEEGVATGAVTGLPSRPPSYFGRWNDVGETEVVMLEEGPSDNGFDEEGKEGSASSSVASRLPSPSGEGLFPANEARSEDIEREGAGKADPCEGGTSGGSGIATRPSSPIVENEAGTKTKGLETVQEDQGESSDLVVCPPASDLLKLSWGGTDDFLRNLRRPTYGSIREESYELTKTHIQHHLSRPIKYIEEWERVVDARIQGRLMECRRLEANLRHYERKVGALRPKARGIENCNGPKVSKLHQRLERNELKLGGAREAFETYSEGLFLIVEEVVERGWRDLAPVLLAALQFDARCSADRAQISARLDGPIGCIADIGTRHEVQENGRVQSLKWGRPEEVYTGGERINHRICVVYAGRKKTI